MSLDGRSRVYVADPSAKIYNVARLALNGERGLILAVVLGAQRDCLKEDGRLRANALMYFDSSDYGRILEALGLPLDWLPVGLARRMETNDISTINQSAKSPV